MKKSKLFGWALITLASFSACTNDAEEVLTQESEIKLISEITPSRVTSDLQSTQIAEGREIGVTITGSKSGNDYVNKPWTSDGDGGLSTEHPVYWANTNVNVTAYHPYNETWTSGSQTFTVKTDQSVKENYLDSDLLFANKTDVAKSADPISLTFYHKLAKVNVILQPEYPEMDLSNAVISICNTKTSTTIDLFNGTVPTEATGELQEITAGTGLTASAIIAPQTIAASTKFIKIELDEKTFYYTLPSDKQLKSGYSHNYTLTVKETAVQIENSSEIKDWTNDEGNTGDANETDVTPYLTFSANEEQTLTMSKAVATLEYSVNNGRWAELGTTTVTFGGNNGDLRLRGQSSIGTANSTSDYAQIEFETDANVACSGDIRTLIDYENFVTINTTNARFCKLFKDCTNLTSAPQLPAKVLASSCYHSMFSGCTSLITAPELPSTSLANHCYCQMFMDCTSLVNVPSILPAQELFWSCYHEMFMDCTSLEVAPELPATILAQTCYGEMFSGCKALKIAPKLPATTLASLCYFAMFINCQSLVTAPELPAKTLELQSYYRMFAGCRNLNNITILATDISAEDCLNEWVDYVASNGTFTKAKEMTSLPSGSSGIPSGWTVIDKE